MNGDDIAKINNVSEVLAQENCAAAETWYNNISWQ